MYRAGENDPATDTGTALHVHEITAVVPPVGPVLAERFGVGVVVDDDWRVCAVLQRSMYIDAVPSGQRGRADRSSRAELDGAGHGDAETHHVGIGASGAGQQLAQGIE